MSIDERRAVVENGERITRQTDGWRKLASGDTADTQGRGEYIRAGRSEHGRPRPAESMTSELRHAKESTDGRERAGLRGAAVSARRNAKRGRTASTTLRNAVVRSLTARS